MIFHGFILTTFHRLGHSSVEAPRGSVLFKVMYGSNLFIRPFSLSDFPRDLAVIAALAKVPAEEVPISDIDSHDAPKQKTNIVPQVRLPSYAS